MGDSTVELGLIPGAGSSPLILLAEASTSEASAALRMSANMRPPATVIGSLSRVLSAESYDVELLAERLARFFCSVLLNFCGSVQAKHFFAICRMGRRRAFRLNGQQASMGSFFLAD